MIPEAHIVHRSSRRLRLKMPVKKYREDYLKALPEKLAGCPGISEIEINPVTGSVLVKHDGNTKDIIDFVRSKGIFTIKFSSVRPPSVHQSITSVYRNLDGLVQSFSNGSTNAGGLAFLGLIAFGAIQIGKGNFAAPAWYTVFWYAMNIFLKSQPDEAGPDIDAE